MENGSPGIPPDALTANLAGRVALVTGSSRNIGRAIALAYARAGADVVIHARTDSTGAEAVAAEARALGRRAMVCLADVRDPVAVEQAVDAARQQLGPIDILVNCAAVRRESPFEKITLAEWREPLAVVLDGAYLCTRAVVGDMVERRWGVVVNIIGLTAQTGAPRRAHVVTAKAGLIGLTKALALEYADRGITVNGVSPGMIATDRTVGSATAEPEHRRGRVVPVGRQGAPEEVAALCCYLASNAARFVTGQIFAVNGGTYL